jgi:hypothetical protein
LLHQRLAQTPATKIVETRRTMSLCIKLMFGSQKQHHLEARQPCALAFNRG